MDSTADALRAVLDAARDVAASNDPHEWDELDEVVRELVAHLRAAPVDVPTNGRL